jgi:hypothetical protein
MADKTNQTPKKILLSLIFVGFEGAALSDETVVELVRISNLIFLFNKHSFCMM